MTRALPDPAGAPAWRDRPVSQAPGWPDPAQLAAVTAELAALPPLVVPGEVDRLRTHLAAVADGQAFLLQGGDCAETFAGLTLESVQAKVRVLLQMSLVLTYGAAVPVVKLGRMAGQYAKPRSSALELVRGDAVAFPSYRGDAVNSLEPTWAARQPDPRRLLAAYRAAAATLNLVRAHATGGFADLRALHDWTLDFVAASPAGRRYEELAGEIDRALAFMSACGVDLDRLDPAHGVEIFASHEALLLDYEEALTRDVEGRRYGLSGHLLWVGERTRDPEGAHVGFAAGIANPVAVKLGPQVTGAQAVRLASVLDPRRSPGRLTFITRMGADFVADRLPELLVAVRDAGYRPVWACDPMHGNTRMTASGHKTRRFDDVLAEVRGFFAAHRQAGTTPGGLHVEFTGEDVTECLGGGQDIAEADLPDRYETACDPRLNASQAVELAFLVAGMLQEARAAR